MPRLLLLGGALCLLPVLQGCGPGDCAAGYSRRSDGNCYKNEETGSHDTAGDLDFSALAVPPSWMWQANSLMVERDRGWSFALDETWDLKGYTVPQLFVMPDGRYGMLATKMGDTADLSSSYYGRTLLTSTDGLSWEDQGVILRTTDFSVECGNKLQDGAVWIRSPDLYHVVMEGYEEIWADDTGGTVANPWTYFVQATTPDMAAFTPLGGYLFEPEVAEESNSVPSVVTLSDGTGLFYYNGDLMAVTEGGQGIRAVRVNPDTLEVMHLHEDPILSHEQVDPNITYVEGGGLRLYHTIFNQSMDPGSVPIYEKPGIGVVDIGEGFVPSGEVVFALQTDGPCPGMGTCFMDPTVLRLSDGTIVLYATYFGPDVGGNTMTGLRRAISTD